MRLSYSLFWPVVLVFSPKSILAPVFEESRWLKGRAEAERELDRLEANLPQCSAFIRYAPAHDESGECDSQFVFDAFEVLAIMEQRLAELPAEQHGRYPGILEWLRRRDTSRLDPVDVPSLWNRWFLNVAVGMMNRVRGQVRCGRCHAIIPQGQITVDSGPTGIQGSGWHFNIWCCPQGHKLLTKDAMHFFLRKA